MIWSETCIGWQHVLMQVCGASEDFGPLQMRKVAKKPLLNGCIFDGISPENLRRPRARKTRRNVCMQVDAHGQNEKLEELQLAQ